MENLITWNTVYAAGFIVLFINETRSYDLVDKIFAYSLLIAVIVLPLVLGQSFC